MLVAFNAFAFIYARMAALWTRPRVGCVDVCLSVCEILEDRETRFTPFASDDDIPLSRYVGNSLKGGTLYQISKEKKRTSFLSQTSPSPHPDCSVEGNLRPTPRPRSRNCDDTLTFGFIRHNTDSRSCLTHNRSSNERGKTWACTICDG